MTCYVNTVAWYKKIKGQQCIIMAFKKLYPFECNSAVQLHSAVLHLNKKQFVPLFSYIIVVYRKTTVINGRMNKGCV